MIETTLKCPIPRQSQIITAGAAPLPCGEPADVLTEVPMADARGNLFPQLGYTCLDHSVRIATWKLVENLKAWTKENPSRILVPG